MTRGRPVRTVRTMSDRISGFTVVLDNDLKDEDAQGLADAICLMRGVIGVHPVINEPGQAIAEVRARHDIATKVYEALK